MRIINRDKLKLITTGISVRRKTSAKNVKTVWIPAVEDLSIMV